jgi:PPM family protein phosphatase
MVSVCPEPPARQPASTAQIGAYAVEYSLLTDSGCQRQNNEDAIGCRQPDDPAQRAAKGLLALVADGMGGHLAGEVASRTALEIISQTYFTSAVAPAAALAAAFQAANQAIHTAAHSDPTLKGMGTTCTALVLSAEGAYAAHIGDSRLYLVRSGTIVRLTDDHSMVAEMLRHGLLSPAEARQHADRHVLLRALGVAPTADLSLWETPLLLCDGDRFVLCSDGLHDLVTDDEINELAAAAAPAEACAQLVALARARGGPDNISVSVLSLTRPALNASAGPAEVDA